MSTPLQLINTAGASGIALSGFDPVAFFTDHRPVNGDPSICGKHLEATYLFATQEHKDLFVRDPEKYLPQTGGFCTFGVSVGALFPVDITTWQIRNGKLYFNLNPAILTAFNAEFAGNVAKANANWPGLVEKNGQ